MHHRVSATHILKRGGGAKEMVQGLGTCMVFAEDPSLLPHQVA